MKIIETPYYSFKLGRLPQGCELCVKGLKSVLFVTGLCHRKCIFCPISDKKKNKDVIYINERPVSKEADVIEEIKLCGSKGVGITGGDPLLKMERTISYIRLLKKEFGKDFHIHLYTSLDVINEKNLKELYEAGLNEIRFHPELINEEKHLKNIDLALKYDWDVGIEIPVLPDQKDKIIKLIDSINKKVKFLNLNELEYTDELSDHNYVCREHDSYAIAGSQELAMELLDYCTNKELNVHFCTVKLKDWVQLKNRLINRANNVKKWYDKVSDDGMLLRGAVYLDTTGELKDLNKLKEVMKKYKDFELDENKHRLLTSLKNIEKLKNKLKREGLFPARVEEYPTFDLLEVDIEFL